MSWGNLSMKNMVLPCVSVTGDLEIENITVFPMQYHHLQTHYILKCNTNTNFITNSHSIWRCTWYRNFLFFLSVPLPLINSFINSTALSFSSGTASTSASRSLFCSSRYSNIWTEPSSCWERTWGLIKAWQSYIMTGWQAVTGHSFEEVPDPQEQRIMQLADHSSP